MLHSHDIHCSPERRLPLEVVLIILSFLQQQISRNPPRIFLATSLVAKSWVDPSQKLMWEHIYIPTPTRLALLMESKALGKYPIKHLKIDANLEEYGLRQVLSRVPAVHRFDVELPSVRGLAFLKFPAFRDLHTLRVILQTTVASLSVQLDDLGPFVTPARLKKLEISDISGLLSLTDLKTLLAPSFETLTDLTLSCKPVMTRIPGAEVPFFRIIPFFSKHLTKLSLQDYFPPNVSRDVSKCKRLLHLEIDTIDAIAGMAVLDDSPDSIEELIYEFGVNNSVADVRAVCERLILHLSNCTKWPSLKWITFGASIGLPFWAITDRDFMREIKDACRVRELQFIPLILDYDDSSEIEETEEEEEEDYSEDNEEE